jgi:hypothetical protein
MSQDEDQSLLVAKKVLEEIQANCKECTPAFDEEAAGKMTSKEIRMIFPRFYGFCHTCGFNGVKYASSMHYYMGDY